MELNIFKFKQIKLNLFFRTLIYSLLIILISFGSYFGSIPVLSNFLHDIENQTYDLLFLIRHKLNFNPKTPKDIVIIGIDAASIKKVGVPWPWPRQFHGSLVDALHESNAKSVFFDIIFDTISPLSLQTQDIDGDNVSMSTTDAGKEDDDIFGMSISNAMNVFLACEAEPLSKTKYHVALPIDTYLDALNNDPSFLGNTAVTYDDDNFVRRVKVIYREFFKDPAISSSIPLRVSQFILNKKAVVLPDGFVKIGTRKIPEKFLINYYGPCGTIKTIPYWKALDYIYSGKGKVFKNKIVLVGRTNLKASIDPFRSVRAPDSFATPFSKITPNFSGVEVQATIISNILNEHYIKNVSTSSLFIILFFISLIASLSAYYFRAKLLTSLYCSVFLSAGYLIFSFLLFTFFMIATPPTFPIYGLIIPIFFVNFLDQYFVVDSTRRRQAKFFKQLVSPQVAEEIEKMGYEELALGGTRREITVIFTDIQNFTSLCERIKPEVVVSILNKFLTEMVKIIHKHNGLVDKFIGDAIMALWGTPKHMDSKEQAESALSCALAMRDGLKVINEIWRGMGFEQDLNIRIGVNTDEAITGNLGSPQRAQFSAIGDGVNVASRLEGVNKVYGTGILFSEKTYNLIDKNHFNFREIDTVLVPGKATPIRIFELIDPRVFNEELIRTYEEALKSYRNKDFDGAIKLWEKCLKIKSEDKPSLVMLNRAMKFKDKITEEELIKWSHVWSVDSK